MERPIEIYIENGELIFRHSNSPTAYEYLDPSPRSTGDEWESMTVATIPQIFEAAGFPIPSNAKIWYDTNSELWCYFIPLGGEDRKWFFPDDGWTVDNGIYRRTLAKFSPDMSRTPAVDVWEILPEVVKNNGVPLRWEVDLCAHATVKQKVFVVAHTQKEAKKKAREASQHSNWVVQGILETNIGEVVEYSP